MTATEHPITDFEPDVDPVQMWRLRLGAKLKHMREWDNKLGRRLTTEGVADMLKEYGPIHLVMSRSKLVTLEQGKVEPNMWDVDMLCHLY